jgi:hypothetical protein
MSSQNITSVGTIREGSKTSNRSATRFSEAETKAWKAAILQVAREGTSADIAARLADMEARGDVTRSPDEEELDEDEIENGQANDAEINLADEDLARLEEIDGPVPDFPVIGRRLGQGLFSADESPEQFLSIELRVEGDKCRLLRPHWMPIEAVTQTGEDFLDEVGTRFGALEAVGKWLGKHRKGFLKQPEPIALGVNALQEMKDGLPSVSPGAFLRLSGIEAGITRLAGSNSKKKGDVNSLFSRFIEGCHLVWNDGSLPLDFIFSIEARKAWVASAVLQVCEEAKSPLTKNRLAKYLKITVPKSSVEKKTLSDMNVSSLSFPDFIRSANCMAETNWSDVVDSYLQTYL